MITLNDESGELKLNGGVVTRLSQSEVIVLSLLIHNKGNLLSKDILLDQGWPNKVVAPNSLTAAIKNIRKALGNIPIEIVIETVYRRGYILHHNDYIIVTSSKDSREIIKDNLSEEPQDMIVAASARENKNTTTISDDLRHIVYNSDNATNIIVHAFNFRRYVYRVLLSSYILMAVIWAIVMHIGSEPIICYEYEEKKICGVFELSENSRLELLRVMGEQRGMFLYGYNKILGQIELYQMD